MSENASAGSSVKIRKTKRETLSEWFRSPGFKCILMGIVTFLLILILFFVVCVPKKYDLSVGKISHETINATKDVVDIVSTQEKKEAAAAQVEPTYNFQAGVKEEVMNALSDTFYELRTIQQYEQRQKNNWVNATFNNNLVSAQAFFTWCVKKKFIEKNPFYGISKKKKEAKKRTVINADARAIMREWFMNNNPGYLLICELVFQSLIRPTEISKLRVSDVDLEHKVIHLDGSITKTKYSRKAVLSDELIEILGRNIQGANQDDYLISNGYLPGKEPISSRMYRKTWDKMRKQCHLPDTMQLYSLRDTGIISLFDNGADANTVKGAADHHNLNITSIYCDHVDDNLVEKVRKHSAKF